MFPFAIDYYLTVSIAATGVIQIAASLGNLHGLVFFGSKVVARFVGAILVVVPTVWFFFSEPRNINDYEGGLDANEQAIFFVLGTFTALFVTLIASSLLNFRMKAETEPEAGLDAVKSATYARAILVSLRYWTKQWRIQIKSYLLG